MLPSHCDEFLTSRNAASKRPHHFFHNSSRPIFETADLVLACRFMVSRRALAPVAACGEATKPVLAPNGLLNQQSLFGESGRW